MDGKITFEKSSIGVLGICRENVFLLFSPRQFKIELVSCRKIDTEVTAFLPLNLRFPYIKI